MIQVIFLDIDDTLLSFSEYVKQAMRDGFKKYGLKPYTDDMFDTFKKINDQLWQQIERGELSYEELLKTRWNIIFKALGISFDGLTFETYFKGQLFYSAIPMPYAKGLLQYLAPKYTLCVASNGPYKQQMNRLRLADMEGYFKHFFISERFRVTKPEKTFFDCCFQELHDSGFPDLMPEETMMIGDSISSDIAGGAAYGMKTCLLIASNDARAIGVADYTVMELREIMAIL